MSETSNEFPQAETTNPHPENSNATAGEPTPNLQPSTSPYLLHIQSDEVISLPKDRATIMLGKPNSHHPPDIDLSCLADAEIISRQHALIHIEGETYYIEDLGSSNGTYVNHTAVARGERQEISSGDVLALGKEDKVTFIFKFPE
jgi:hypothetical protein